MVYSYKPKSDSNDSIMAAISGLCISMKADDYLDLPPVINDIKYVQLDAKAKKAYEDMERTSVLELIEAGEDITALSAAALSTKLQQ